MRLDTLCKHCRVILPNNVLIKQVLQQLNRTSSHHGYIKDMMIDWIRHMRKFTETTPFHMHTALSISEELTALDAPIHNCEILK